jgi:hypothetical protein
MLTLLGGCLERSELLMSGCGCGGGQMTAAKRAQMLGAAHAEDLTLLDSQLARQVAAWRRKRRLPAAPPLQHACTGRCTYRCALGTLCALCCCLPEGPPALECAHSRVGTIGVLTVASVTDSLQNTRALGAQKAMPGVWSEGEMVLSIAGVCGSNAKTAAVCLQPHRVRSVRLRALRLGACLRRCVHRALCGPSIKSARVPHHRALLQPHGHALGGARSAAPCPGI